MASDSENPSSNGKDPQDPGPSDGERESDRIRVQLTRVTVPPQLEDAENRMVEA
jgi:hypothetical protein